MGSTSYIEISSDALTNNIDFLNSILKKGVKISAVLKGNAYGHGTDKILPALEKNGINHFSFYSSSEAKTAFECKHNTTTILIMGFILPNDYKFVIKNKIEFFVYEIDVLYNAINVAKELNTKAIIHIDIETGMNRTGFTLKNLKKAINIINKNIEFLDVKGVTSHLAGAESIANHFRIIKQLSKFIQRVKLLNENNIYPQIKHIACSAAAMNYINSQFDMIRTGILIYGYWPTKETYINYVHKHKIKIDPLHRVMEWKTYVMSIKNVNEGEFVGYGLGYQAQTNIKIMLVPVGYANGYSRSLSNNGHVLVNSMRAQVIGTVNMNIIICDISQIENVKIGDGVVLIGKQGDNEISFASFAEMNNSLNYEILARLPENIKRIVV
ncbi:MAG: alanine racemase [Bacteroidales bacterium]|nr:alanine racemase [Bacteroidales bacterium]